MENADSITAERKRDLRFFALMLAAFVLIGIVNTFLGPLLPALSARWNLDYTEAGYLFTMQFAGSITGATASGVLMKRFGIVRLITWGLILMAASVVGISLGERWAGMAAIFMSGITLGVTIPAINFSVAEMNPSRRAEALNILNFAWGGGAVASPIVISQFTNESNITLPLMTISVLLVALSALTTFIQPFELSSIRQSKAGVKPGTVVWLSPYVWMGFLLIFIYVGVETATGGWLASYAKSLNISSGSLWAMVQSLFWTGLLTGRIAAPLFLRYLSESSLVLVSATVAVAGIAVILMSASVATVSIGSVVAGFGLAPIFPTTLALMTEYLGERARPVTGYIFVVAGLGGAIIPWFVGFASERYSNLRTGLSVTLAGAISLVILQACIIAYVRRVERRRG